MWLYARDAQETGRGWWSTMGRKMERGILKQSGDKEWRCSRRLALDSMESWSMMAGEAEAEY